MMLLALPRGALVPIRESRLHTNTAWHLPVGIVSAGVDPAAPRAVAAAAAGTRLGRTRAAGEEVKRRRGCDRAGLGRLHRVSGTSWQARAAAITPCAGRRRLSSFSIRVQALSLPPTPANKGRVKRAGTCALCNGRGGERGAVEENSEG